MDLWKTQILILSDPYDRFIYVGSVKYIVGTYIFNSDHKENIKT